MKTAFLIFHRLTMLDFIGEYGMNASRGRPEQ